MKLKTYFEPFSELLLSSYSLQFRLMRFFARLACIRNMGFDKSYDNPLANVQLVDLVTPISPEEIVRNLRRDGVSSSLRLSASLLADLMQFVATEPFVDRANRQGSYLLDGGQLRNPGSGHAYAIFDPHLKFTRLKSFALTEIKPIADAYLGADSHLMGSQIWATFPNSIDDGNPEFGFHYDIDDYRFLKLFVYLSDVDDTCGPHQIIFGSHKGRPLFRFFNRRLTHKDVKQFGDRVKTMVGQQGYGFFEDTLCYHRGVNPKKARLILQIQFSLTGEKGNNQ